VTPIGDALRLVMARFGPLPVERVPLDEALGRFLAETLPVREALPAFDNSAMDGYAVRAADVEGAQAEAPVTLPLGSESRAGGAWPAPLKPGEAARIFTGAPMPEGADAVVIQEDTRAADGVVEILEAAAPRQHVRFAAEVLAVGDALLEAGTEVGPNEIAVLAGQGYASVPVHRRPRVAILSTGDELREIGEAPRPGTLVDSNRYALAAAVRAAGGLPWTLPRGADEVAATRDLVLGGLAGADVLVSTGGASVGDYDVLADAFVEAGLETVFYKVRMKPGKPIRFAVEGAGRVFGLPGNPVSALVGFDLFVRPALRAMLGDPRPHRPVREATLATPGKAPFTRTELARGRFTDDGRVALYPRQASNITTSLLGNEAFAILPMGAGRLEAGSTVRVLDLTARTTAALPFAPGE
jgi:molybdopterin molybdotransferase